MITYGSTSIFSAAVIATVAWWCCWVCGTTIEPDGGLLLHLEAIEDDWCLPRWWDSVVSSLSSDDEYVFVRLRHGDWLLRCSADDNSSRLWRRRWLWWWRWWRLRFRSISNTTMNLLYARLFVFEFDTETRKLRIAKYIFFLQYLMSESIFIFSNNILVGSVYH